jgi:ABC-type lipoprotein export system ATPase subunit
MITHDDKIAKEAKHIVNLKDGRISKWKKRYCFY